MTSDANGIQTLMSSNFCLAPGLLLIPQKQTSTAKPQISSSTPSVGVIAPPSTPPTRSIEPPSTPPSTGYPPASLDDMDYTPPFHAALLPGARQCEDLMILVEYINSTFKQTGNSGALPTEAEKASMQELLHQSTCKRPDMEAAFLHAVSIVCKAHKALQAAVVEVGGSDEAFVVEGVTLGEDAAGFRSGFSSERIAWGKVDLRTMEGLKEVHLQRGILQAFGAVAEVKMAIVDVYRRQMDTRAKAEDDDGDGMQVEGMHGTGSEEGGVKVDGESTQSKDEDEGRMEVDSVVEV